MLLDTTYTTTQALKAVPAGESRAFSGVFLLKKIAMRMARNGSEFMVVEVGDRTGAFSFNCFADSGVFQTIKELTEGAIVKLEGTTSYYQDRFSPKVHTAVALDPKESCTEGWLDQLLEASLEDPQAMWEELQTYIEAIQHEGLRATVKYALQEVESVFRVIPAAISMHHAYRYGLLEHTIHMARAAKALLPLYPEVEPNLVLAGILLHDLGKTIEYQGEVSIKKSRKGLLQGHVVLGYRIVRKAAIQAKLAEPLFERLEHIILSHQGELEWGAAVLACTPEAVFVSLVDNLDAKLGAVQYALRHATEGATFSDYLPCLRTSLLTEGIE